MKAAEPVGFSNPKDVRNAKTAVSAIVLNQVDADHKISKKYYQ
jgi:hypothetical protein